MKLAPGIRIGRILQLSGDERKEYDELNEMWKSALSKHLDLVNRMQSAEIIFKGRVAEKAWKLGWQSKGGAIVYDQEEGRICELLRDDEEVFG